MGFTGGFRFGVHLRDWFLSSLYDDMAYTGHCRRVSLQPHLSLCVLTLVVMGCVLRTPNILGISILSQASSPNLGTLYSFYIAFSLRYL